MVFDALGNGNSVANLRRKRGGRLILGVRRGSIAIIEFIRLDSLRLNNGSHIEVKPENPENQKYRKDFRLANKRKSEKVVLREEKFDDSASKWCSKGNLTVCYRIKECETRERRLLGPRRERVDREQV